MFFILMVHYLMEAISTYRLLLPDSAPENIFNQRINTDIVFPADILPDCTFTQFLFNLFNITVRYFPVATFFRYRNPFLLTDLFHSMINLCPADLTGTFYCGQRLSQRGKVHISNDFPALPAQFHCRKIFLLFE
jgi:hypothetical protein